MSDAGLYEGKRVTVMGLGVFGGGAGVTRFLVGRGARVTVTDLRSPEELAKGLAMVEDLPVTLILGEHREGDFTETDLVIANPAVPVDSPFLAMARDHGVPVDSEIGITLRLLEGRRILGVTGSNGKTTTAHLVHHMVKAAGKPSWLGGNVGGSLLPELHRIGGEDVVVLELSSFQLELTGGEGIGPGVGVITNITPNHLDRHRTFEAYIEAKSRILVRAGAAVINADDPVSRDRFKDLSIPVLRFSSRSEVEEGYFLRDGAVVERIDGRERPVIEKGQVRLPGVFNLENLMAALAGVRLILDGVPDGAPAAGAAFKGVPHRLEVVATREGVRYINDSIATTPVSCIAALDAVGGEIHLIAGGYDKKLPLEEMAEAVIRKVRAVYLVGETGPMLEAAVLERAHRTGLPCPDLEQAGDLEAALRKAARAAAPGSTVLLSPGFASYDQFLNFVERGECFRRLVAAL